MTTKRMTGRTIAHYEILEQLGEGGMGVVYKARDTHLDRFVAIKVLPPEKVADPERKRRFVQEAKAASALNHPNIIVIHDISSEAGQDFIVMEHVTGKSLDALIPRKGMRIGEALKCAVQIADALTRAHAAGIIHRDLKPGNVMVDEHGLVKVLDFGLAKLAEAPEKPEEAPTQTAEGVIVGTVAYMSPEQAEGKPVDARSDIFSFGSLLYEMVTGQRPFRGDSNLSTLAAIIKQEPAPLPAEIPHDLEKLITRCLRKDPARRFQTMADLKVALEDLKEESDSGALASGAGLQPARPKRTRVLVGAGALVVVLAGLIYWLLSTAGQTGAGPLKAVPLTAYPGQEWSPTFSPNGNQVAFTWNGEKQDNFDIYVQMIGTGARLRLTQDPALDYSPAWSPDERHIAFLRQLPQGQSGVFLIAPIGGRERKLAQVQAAFSLVIPPITPRLAWSPGSRWLGVRDGRALVVISTETGEKRPLTSPPSQRNDLDPAFSPDGRTVAFARGTGGYSADLYTLRLSPDMKPEGEPVRLAGDRRRLAAAVWTARGDEIVYWWGLLGGSGLWRIPTARAGAPRQIALPGANVYQPAVSRQGTRLAYAQWYWDSDIWRIELDRPGGKAVRTSRLAISTRLEYTPHSSPDGSRIAFTSHRSGDDEIWICDSDGTNPVQLTFAGGLDGGTPRWSPDGESIAFDSRVEGQADIYVIGSRGGKPRRITMGAEDDTVPSWSRDGKWIYYRSNRSGQGQVWKIPADGGEPVQVTKQGGYAPMESPDGRFLYYNKALGGSTGLWRLELASGEETQVLESLYYWGAFAIVESGIYFMPPKPGAASAPLQFLEFSSGAVRTLATIEKPLFLSLAVSPNGRVLLYDQLEKTDSDLMLVDNFR